MSYMFFLAEQIWSAEFSHSDSKVLQFAGFGGGYREDMKASRGGTDVWMDQLQ